MKPALAVAFTLLLAASSDRPAIKYFSRTRTVNVSSADRQNYFVVDSDVWTSARPDLDDLRVYDGTTQVPYVLTRQTGGSSNQEREAKILNLGRVGKYTEFDLDTDGLNQYDRVRLQIDTKNFVDVALVEGLLHLNDASRVKLGSSTLYDFTNEGLGSNFTLKFPSASFPYLHVRLAPGITPAEVKGAYISSFSESKAAWTSAGMCSAAPAAPKQTVFNCSINQHMPVERVQFSLPDGAVNFNRTVILSDAQGNEFQSGAISRVRIRRAGRNVTSDEFAIDVYPRTDGQIRVAIHNGDDAPLPISQVTPLSVERRVYFDPHGKTSLQLFYGDTKLDVPVYDYAKLFQPASDAAVAQLGPGMPNPEFTKRPDGRPWSERHKLVLWGAMLLAVAVLGALAISGMKRSPATKQ